MRQGVRARWSVWTPLHPQGSGNFCGVHEEWCVGTGIKTGKRGGGEGRVSPAASALAKLWKGELVPPLPSSAATAWCPIILVRLLVGDSNTSMRLGEHVGSIGDGMSASNPRSRGRFWHASITKQAKISSGGGNRASEPPQKEGDAIYGTFTGW